MLINTPVGHSTLSAACRPHLPLQASHAFLHIGSSSSVTSSFLLSIHHEFIASLVLFVLSLYTHHCDFNQCEELASWKT